MKKYEKESLLKSFFIFFTLLLILLGVIFFQSYKQELHTLDDKLLNKMKICSFDLKCKDFELDFMQAKNDLKTQTLYKTKNELFGLFEVPTVKKYYLKVIYPKSTYEKNIKNIKIDLAKKFFIYAILIALLSFLFSLYALYPLKKALNLNEEFIKDILHDINTPLSSLVVNLKLFKKELGEDKKLERMQTSINTILALQNNLKAFLNESVLQKEEVDLKLIIDDRVGYFKQLYPNINFFNQTKNIKLFLNKDAFIRIMDNLLSNACKYAKEKNPYVKIYLVDKILVIEDNAKGIKNVDRVFDRFYKETSRGIGIGMNIVKKLCDELGIKITIKSKENVGTKIFLDLKNVIK